MTAKQALMESLKEFVRNGLLSGIMAFLTVVVQGLNTTTGEVNINYALAIVLLLSTVLGALVTAIDRFIHKWDGTELNGLFPKFTGLN